MSGFVMVVSTLFSLAGQASPLDFADPAKLAPPPPDAAGFPSSDTALDAKKGFEAPPPGYGEVPYWWWTGDPLDRDRLLWQLDKLHAAGIPGVQINYAHDPGMLTYPVEPPIFSDAWWEFWTWITGECRKRGMGIGMSGYTIDWPGHDNLFYQIGITDGSLRGASLDKKTQRAEGGKPFTWKLPDDFVSVTAYQMNDKAIVPGSEVSLLSRISGGNLEWTPSAGQWQVVAIVANSPERSVDPMNPASGQKVIEKFFQPFADKCPGDTGKALNYFFHDELNFGVNGWLWSDRFAAEFEKRKGYDIMPVLPALFLDIGPKTPKIRLDYSDVMVALTEECFFRPVFEWHWKRGIMYACDPGSRGGDPVEFGDYFRCVRWYAAPGHDTPGGKADLRKDKVSSSIAHLYQRPRVWLEGYHSLGWGATPATIFDSSCKNFLYGASLLNLHGLYYTTHGGYWEWAPPCFHWRMPYWDHMGSFMKYFERLSYLLSQGVHRCDVAVMYPTAPLEAGMGGEDLVDDAFEAGNDLYMKHGIDFDFIDFESLDRAKIQDRQLCVSGEAYRVLVLPSMKAVRQSSLDKALAFFRAGGVVIATGELPEASDRIGRQDAALDAQVKEIFGATAAEARDNKSVDPQANAAGGVGAAVKTSSAAAELITKSVPRDFVPGSGGQVLHRKIDERDVYMIMGAPKNSECVFRAKGTVELWDPWTGETTPIHTVIPSADSTTVRMPLGKDEAQLIVLSPGDAKTTIEKTDLDDVADVDAKGGKVTVTGYAKTGGEKTATVRQGGKTLTLKGEAPAPIAPLTVEGLWDFELKPTLDNRWGDFRLPVTTPMIGAEARRFSSEMMVFPHPGMLETSEDVSDLSKAKTVAGFGPMFWKLGPLPNDAAADETLAALTSVQGKAQVSPDCLYHAQAVNGKEYQWGLYSMSMRFGVKDDPGPQGHHGLKEKISDDFIVLGKPKYTGIEIKYEKEPEGSRYYMWTTARAPRDGDAVIRVGEFRPSAVWINGRQVDDLSAKVTLKTGPNPVLLRYDGVGRTHFVLEMADTPSEPTPYPLAMRWYTDPALVPFDAALELTPAPGEDKLAGPIGVYHFGSPPGLRAMTFAAHGKVAAACADGALMTVTPGATRPDGAVEYTATVAQPNPLAVKVALSIVQDRGYYGGAALPEPIALDSGPGQIPLGDWSQMGALADYSGGAWYRKTVTLTKEQVTGRVTLDLGKVVASAEILINGKKAGVKITPPWSLDVSEYVRIGENKIEILVCNTLANHYGTIPTHYRGSPESGLIGPVTIQTNVPVVLR